MKIAEILKCTKGRLISGDSNTEAASDRFSTDSRSLKKGDLFVALKGANFDGNDFVAQALRRGAIGAVISNHVLCNKYYVRKSVIHVTDTTAAYGAIANYHRMRFAVPVVAVTGSNGKTTTKDMMSHVLSGRFKVLKNEGTKNNNIGVPETLLKLNKGIDIAVLELGMNHPGEIKTLSGIARPSAGVVTNIGESHLEFLDGLENVYKAKKELLGSLPCGAAAIVNGDDRLLSRFRAKRLEVVTFGFGRHNNFRASNAKWEDGQWRFMVNERHPFELNMLGGHNIYNALAAIAAASYFKVHWADIQRRIAAFRQTSAMRLAINRIGGIEFINDAYNSNPLSMRCAINSLLDYEAKGKRFLISGDMLELGSRARRFHAAVGELAAQSGVDFLFTIGDLSRHTAAAALARGMKEKNAVMCRTHKDAACLLRRLVKKGDVVLIKGSRAMRMERVMDYFAKSPLLQTPNSKLRTLN